MKPFLEHRTCNRAVAVLCREMKTNDMLRHIDTDFDINTFDVESFEVTNDLLPSQDRNI